MRKFLLGAACLLAFALPARADDMRIGVRTDVSSIDPHFHAWSPVKNPENGAIPGVSGQRKYSRLQGSCLEPAKSLQIRAPVAAGRELHPVSLDTHLSEERPQG
jgi:hypothetical protein